MDGFCKYILHRVKFSVETRKLLKCPVMMHLNKAIWLELLSSGNNLHKREL